MEKHGYNLSQSCCEQDFGGYENQESPQVLHLSQSGYATFNFNRHSSAPSTPVPIAQRRSKSSLNFDLPVENQCQPNTMLYKTEMCRSWVETGNCRYGSKCQFAHGEDELRPVTRHPRYKTEICQTFHQLGTCKYGTRCRFIHLPPDNYDTNQYNTPITSSTDSTEYNSNERLPVFKQLSNEMLIK